MREGSTTGPGYYAGCSATCTIISSKLNGALSVIERYICCLDPICGSQYRSLGFWSKSLAFSVNNYSF